MRIFPLSESAVTAELGTEISPELNSKAIRLAERFNRERFPGLVEAVPAYASVTLFYDTADTRKAFPDHPTAFDAVSELVRRSVDTASESTDEGHSTVDIPMIVSAETSPDLERISGLSGLQPDKVIDMFLARTYRVYMLGFLPGFACMGEVDDRIATPRLAAPRTKVIKGSIGIAGRQTGIYPLDSPGGWNIIGRTDISMFDPYASPPCLLKPGDRVRFTRSELPSKS